MPRIKKSTSVEESKVDYEMQITDEAPGKSCAPGTGGLTEGSSGAEFPKKRATRKVSVKKDTKKTTEKLLVSFKNPYAQDRESEDYEYDPILHIKSDNLEKNIKRILEEKTDLEVKNSKSCAPGTGGSRKDGDICFELKKTDLSTTPLDSDYITKLVHEHLLAYTENRERLDRMRSCKIKELDGKFYVFVMSKEHDYGFSNTEEVIEMAFEAGDYIPIEFS
jgi:hypothetical protein